MPTRVDSVRRPVKPPKFPYRRLSGSWKIFTFTLFVIDDHPKLGLTLHLRQSDQRAQATAGGKDCGAGFFQRCLAKSRGSTPEQRYQWREGVYDEIQELMPLQGSLSVTLASGLEPNETKGTLSEPVPSNGGRATETFGEHRGAVGGAGGSSAAVVEVARSTGPG